MTDTGQDPIHEQSGYDTSFVGIPQPQSIRSTLAERNSTHGSFTDNARIAQQLREVFRDGRWDELRNEHKEALDHIAGKISRILSGNPDHKDHWHDIAGYATLAEQASGPSR